MRGIAMSPLTTQVLTSKIPKDDLTINYLPFLPGTILTINAPTGWYRGEKTKHQVAMIQ
jgi:hypothetical protein